MMNLPGWYWTVIVPACVGLDCVVYAGAAALVARQLWRRFKRSTEATVAIEFAVLAIPMLLIVALGIDGTLAATAKSELVYATQQAATATANGANESAVQSMFAGNIAINISPSLACGPTTGGATCTGTGTYNLIFSGLFGPALALSFKATAVTIQGVQPPA